MMDPMKSKSTPISPRINFNIAIESMPSYTNSVRKLPLHLVAQIDHDLQDPALDAKIFSSSRDNGSNQ